MLQVCLPLQEAELAAEGKNEITTELLPSERFPMAVQAAAVREERRALSLLHLMATSDWYMLSF